ncbi:MAG: SDR family oxidoreductase [Chloroflexaceae bacterium]|jgi:NAD(P)-dependent dehydrogenase (short-subunit alcohol dehydrogenase family)|nr:SDR family oxidoreductase [Chloroflexaceae bacterium]
METPLNGKAVLITGAGSGLGAATARAFAAAGCMVACVDIRQAAAERVRNELTASGEHLALACDVSDAAQVGRTVAAARERFGRLDVLVNNAAVDHTLSVEELTIEQWDQVMGVNLRGPFLFAKAAFPLLREQGGGHIVNIASTAATRAWANAAPYHASKWGLMGFSRSLGVEGRPHNIRVTTMVPGGMRTHFFDRFADQGIPMPDEANLQDPANVAQAILFAVQMPLNSAVQEIIITPMTESSWP